jgi:hypothetical protein
MKSLPPLTEYCQVAFDSKLLIVITPLLVMPSLFNEPVSSKENAHTISNNLPKINSDNTWTLGNDDTWTYLMNLYLQG